MKYILTILLFYLTYINSFSVLLPGFNKAIISNIDIKKISNNDKKELKIIFSKVPLLVFKNQNINPEEFYEFCKIFDDKYNNDILHLFPKIFNKTPQVNLRTNMKDNIDLYNINYYNDPFSNDIIHSLTKTWHQDIVGRLNILPPVVSAIYSPITPMNNKPFTQFANLQDAYDKMDIKLKKKLNNYNVLYTNSLPNNNGKSHNDNDGISVFNKNINYDMKNIQTEPLIIYSDNTKTRKNLLLNPARFLKFDKLNIDDSIELYRYILKNYILSKDNIINHVWQKNDLIIWNNRKLLHTASPSIVYKNENRLSLVLFLGTDEPIIPANDIKSNKIIINNQLEKEFEIIKKKKNLQKYIQQYLDNNIEEHYYTSREYDEYDEYDEYYESDESDESDE